MDPTSSSLQHRVIKKGTSSTGGISSLQHQHVQQQQQQVKHHHHHPHRNDSISIMTVITRTSIVCNIVLVWFIIVLLYKEQQQQQVGEGLSLIQSIDNTNIPIIMSKLNNRTLASNVRRMNAKHLLQRNYIFHGGHPISSDMGGSCYCSAVDDYCMCNPALAIDIVLLSGTDHLWFVRRKDTNQLAIVGGFVDIGETVLDAVYRELYEETGLSISSSSNTLNTVLVQEPVLFGVYSDPRRDKRRHTVSVAYAIHLNGHEQLVASDDVKDVIRLPITDIATNIPYLFADQKTIVQDYIRLYYDTKPTKTSNDFITSNGDFISDIHRSVCVPFNVANTPQHV